jgi:hypothetical protein
MPNKHFNVYVTELSHSLSKRAGVLDTVGGLAKSFIVDPAIGTFKDPYNAIRSGLEGDWSAAGGHALTGAGNALLTLSNAAMLVPGVGALVGGAGRAAGLGLKGLSTIKGLQGTRALNALNKAVNSIGSAGKTFKTVQVSQGGKVVGTTSSASGVDVVKQMGLKGQKGVTEKILARGRHGQSGLAGSIVNAGDRIRNFASSLPLIGRAMGFRDMYGVGRVIPGFRGHAWRIAKPIATLGATLGGGSMLIENGLVNQFNNLNVDPNFRPWFGANQQDEWIMNNRTNRDKIRSMRAFRDLGYADQYKKYIKEYGQQAARNIEDAMRLEEFERQRRNNMPR